MYQGEGAALFSMCQILLETPTQELWKFHKHLDSVLNGSLADHTESDGRTPNPDKRIFEALEIATAQIIRDRKRRKVFERQFRNGTLPEIEDTYESEEKTDE